jgi:ribosomal protein S18 acetylase RimI-like enzyme
LADVLVRSAAPQDAETIVEFNALLAEESEGKTLDAAVLAEGVRVALSRPEMCAYYIAEVDGETAGQTMVTYELSDWRNGVLWWIQSVYVKPEFRRQGIFRALYEHIENRARESGQARGLRLYVEKKNARAIQTYVALGMSASGYLVYEDDWSGAVTPKDET